MADPTPPPPPAAPTPTAGQAFFAKVTEAPAQPHELKSGEAPPPSTPPAQPAPTSTPPAPPTTPPASAGEPKTEGLELPTKGEPPPATPPTQNVGTPPQGADKTGQPPEAPEAEPEETEEQFIQRAEKLNKQDILKLTRKAFGQRTKAEQETKRLKGELLKMADLEKKIASLENAPDTKANAERLEKLEKELTARTIQFEKDKEKLEEDRKYVTGLQLAHDVRQTDEWKTYVVAPSEELVKEIKMVATVVGGTAEDNKEAEEAIKAALRIPDEDQRWQALKAAAADLSPADQARVHEIYKAHKVIAKNASLLEGQSEEALKVVTSAREKKKADEQAALDKEYGQGTLVARKNFQDEFAWVNPDYDISKYPENFQTVVKDARRMADQISSLKLTPAQRAKVDQGYVFFQAAAILGREYAKALERENTEMRDELAKYKAAEETAKKKEEESEKNKGELTPSAAKKKTATPAPATTPQSTPEPGTTAGMSFAKMVLHPPST